MSSFSAQGILDICPKELAGRLDITLFDELDSTNTYLKKLARAGAEEGRIIIARRQSAGRGRLGRSFYSDAEGLYISVLIRPHMKAEGMVFVTAMAAVAMARAIERTVNADARIKWVNDIFVRGKKVCGILCESAFGADALSEYVVIGAGVNIAEPFGGFPADISAVAGALLPSVAGAGHVVFEDNGEAAYLVDAATSADIAAVTEKIEVLGGKVALAMKKLED